MPEPPTGELDNLMRILMLLLILANLGFFAWAQWIAPAEDGLPAGRVNESLGAGLQLAGEVGESSLAPDDDSSRVVDAGSATPGEMPASDQSLDAIAESPDVSGSASGTGDVPDAGASVASEPEYRCVSLGPFDELAAVEVARERLADKGYNARIREAGGQIRSGFWVYLPPRESRSEAKQVEDELREKGVRDLFIVTGSENRNAISLGLFSTPDRADQRAAEIGRLGFSPQIAERFREGTVYWLDYRERGDDRLEPQSIGVLGADEMIPEKRDRDCGAADFAADDAA